jgi:hypothetical protein
MHGGRQARRGSDAGRTVLCTVAGDVPGGGGEAASLQERSDWQSPRVGVRGREESMARAERSGAGAFLLEPPGGQRGEAKRSGCLSALPRRRGAEHRLAAQRKAGAVQPRSVLLSVAALTGPPTAALTGVPIRPFVRELVVAWTPRRHRLGGVSHSAAVDDGGVGPRPARPNDPATSALYRPVC